jgi:hypothetical protein
MSQTASRIGNNLPSARPGTTYLNTRDVKRVIALLDEIEALLRRANRKPAAAAGDIYRWTGVFVPLGRKRS